MKEYLIKILAALGITVAADAPEESLQASVDSAIAKIGELSAAPAKVEEATTAVNTANAARQTAVNELATARTSLAAERTARAGLVITRAVNDGRLTEAKRAEWLGKFTAQGADFNAIEIELGQLTKAVNTKSQTDGLGSRRTGLTGDQGKVSAINEAVQVYKAAHPSATHDQAYNAVKASKPDLFTNDKGE